MHIRIAALAALPAILGALAYGCGGNDLELPSPSGGDPGVDAGVPDGSVDPDSGTPEAGPPPPPPDETKKVFNPTKLHTIDITVDPMYLAQLGNDMENRVPCTVTFNDKTIENAGCRKKGGIGSVQPLSGKPGFSLKFNEFEKGKDLHSLTRLTLNNAVEDSSFLSEHLGYEVYRRAGIPAARTAHGVVRFNGETKGIYVVSESTDKKFLERGFGEGNEEGNLYEGPAFTDFVTDPMGMELKDEVEEMRTRDDIIAFADYVQSAPDATFAEGAKEMVDLDRFITGYAIDAIFHHWDGYSFVVVNNYYMYNDPGSKRFVFMPHGMDQLFDNLNFDVDTRPNGRLSRRVREIPELDQQFHDQIESVLKTAWNVPELIARINQVEAVVNTNTNMDPAAVDDVASFNARVDKVRYAVAYRKSILLGEPLNVCGNGVVEPPEDCDDSNTKTGDGCSSTCFDEKSCVPASYAGASYAFCLDPHTFLEAEYVCKGYDATLAVPDDAAENDWVASTAMSLGNQNYWIGVDDQEEDGKYVKPDGTPVTFFAWGNGEPDGNDAKNCVSIDPAAGGGWNDKVCTQQFGAICKLP